MELNDHFLIEKRNTLNELRRNSMALQELRFFSIYLAKINARDITSRKVSFPLKDFVKIMEIDKVNLWRIKQVTDGLLTKIVHLDSPNGGYSSFQLFKECNLYQDELQQWRIEIDAHDKALPLMFQFKKDYFTYELWNALKLKSSNQLRMYELLKQFEKIGERTIPLPKLKEFLGLEPTQYSLWNNFKLRILDSCQQALQENTDICFTYEPIKVGRKFTGVKFFISKNENYIDQLTLREFLDGSVEETDIAPYISEYNYSNKHIELLASACNNEFSEDKIQILNSLMNDISTINPDMNFAGEGRFLYLQSKYQALNLRCSRTDLKPISDRFAYLKKIVVE